MMKYVVSTAIAALAACGSLDPAADSLFCSPADPCREIPDAVADAGAGGAPDPGPARTSGSASAPSSGSAPHPDAGPHGGADAGAGGPCAPCHSLITEEATEAQACATSAALWHAYVDCACEFGHPCYAACAVGMNYCATHRWQDATDACASCQVTACGPEFWACSGDK